MYNTHFRNSSGLHHSDQFSNAADMAKLALAIKNDFPQYFPLFKKTNFKFKNQEFKSHNHVLKSSPSVTGMKTGYTQKSGYNLITTANYKGKSILAVIIGAKTSKQRDQRMLSLIRSHLHGSRYLKIHHLIPKRKPPPNLIWQ